MSQQETVNHLLSRRPVLELSVKKEEGSSLWGVRPRASLVM